MNAPVLEKSLNQRLAIVDCDIHPVHKSPASLRPYLPERWQEHAETFGAMPVRVWSASSPTRA